MIDYSNSYPVQITTNVTKDTPWLDILTNAPYIKPIVETGLKKWYPSNYNKKTGELYVSEEHKNLFVKLRFGGHYHSNEDLKVLKRFEERYKSDKNLRKKINRYIELTELNYRPISKKTWDNPFGTFKMIGPKFNKKTLGIIPSFEKTELGKEYDMLEFDLRQEFSKI